jgi:hypothetical protein
MDDDTAQESAPQRRLGELLSEAYDEVVSAILAKLQAGGNPSRVSRYPTFSLRDNGMPSLSDGAWTGAGPLEYSSLFEPPYNDHEARQLGKFPPVHFPAVARLAAFSREYPEIARIPATVSDAEDPLTKVAIDLLVARAADVHFLRFGEAPATAATRAVVLKPLFKGLFDAPEACGARTDRTRPVRLRQGAPRTVCLYHADVERFAASAMGDEGLRR